MPEYTPVYVVTGFLDSGKTSLLNQLLSRRLESGHSLCCIQFEQGEQALEQDLIDRGNLDLLHFPVRKLQSGAGMQQVSKQIYDYLLRNDPEELWIEWNGTLPISVLQTLFPPAKKQDGGTPGDFCQLQRMLYLADSTKLDALLQQTGGMALEQISASDVIVRRQGTAAELGRYGGAGHAASGAAASLLVFAGDCLFHSGISDPAHGDRCRWELG